MTRGRGNPSAARTGLTRSAECPCIWSSAPPVRGSRDSTGKRPRSRRSPAAPFWWGQLTSYGATVAAQWPSLERRVTTVEPRREKKNKKCIKVAKRQSVVNGRLRSTGERNRKSAAATQLSIHFRNTSSEQRWNFEISWRQVSATGTNLALAAFSTLFIRKATLSRYQCVYIMEIKYLPSNTARSKWCSPSVVPGIGIA